MHTLDAAASRRLRFGLILIVCLFGVFVLPWITPALGAPVVSDSYMVGFANWVSWIALLGCAAGLAAIGIRRPATPAVETSLLRVDTPQRRWSLTVVCACAAISLVSGVALMWLTRGVAYGETGFFMDRSAQLAAGYRPFFDFGYGYTLGGLYAQDWLWRLFGPHGLSPLTAYDAVYVVFLLGSWWALYALCARFELSDKRRAWILACLGLACTLNATLGIQYVLLRFLAPAMTLLALHAWISPASRGPRRKVFGGLLVALGGLALALVVASPEMAIATFVGTLAYLAMWARHERQRALVCAALYLACLGPLALLGARYFALVASFAGGGFNIPVLFGPPAIAYVVAALVVAALLGDVLRSSSPGDRRLVLALAVVGYALVPAALGRADYGHILANGLILFVLAAVFLARLRPRYFLAFTCALLIVFGAAQYLGFTQFDRTPLLAAVATARSVPAGEFATLSRDFAGVPGTGPSLSRAREAMPRTKAPVAALARYRQIATPAGLYEGDYEIAFELAERHQLALDPVAGEGFTERDLERKLQALSHADCLLIPRYFASSVESAAPLSDTPAVAWQSASRAHSFFSLTFCPLTLYERRLQPNLGWILAAYIKQNFRPAGEWGYYVVYVPR